MATSVNYIQGNSLRIILPLMVIQLHEDGTTTEGSFVPLDGDVFAITLKGKRVYHYTPTIEEIDGEHCAVFILSGVELCGTYSLELVVSRADGTRLRYANPDALTLEHFTGEVSGGTGGAPLIIGGVVLDASLFIFAKGDKGDDGADGADGVGIVSITKTGTSGLVDTYTITYTDGNSTTFTVTNGHNGTDGTDGTDGVGVVSIVQTTTSTEGGGINVITCTLTNGDVSTFEIRNGKDGGGSSITIDPTPTQGSTNAVASGGVYDALQGKQNTLTFDNVPTEDSLNPVKSGGVYDALRLKEDKLTFDNAPQTDSSNPVKSKGIYDALLTKQDTLTFDNAPTQDSSNPVKSGGIYDAVSVKYEKPSTGIPETDLSNAVQTSLGKADTALQSTFCPIIEDTRSSPVAAITGVAPFASLVDGQRIIIRMKYKSETNSTLQLTLSGGSATTAIPIYICYNNGISRLGNGYLPAGAYIYLIYEQSNDRWIEPSHDLNTVYASMTQAEIDAGTVTNTRSISPKLLCDNFQKIRTVKSEEVTSNAVTITLDATKYHVPDDEVDTITMNLPSSYTAADEFVLCFTCNSSSCTVNLPTGVTLADNCDNFSEVAAGVFFQVSIMDDVAAYLCVTPTTP